MFIDEEGIKKGRKMRGGKKREEENSSLNAVQSKMSNNYELSNIKAMLTLVGDRSHFNVEQEDL